MACSLVPGLGWILVFFFVSSVVDRKSCVAASHMNFVNPNLTKTTSIASRQYRTGYHFQPLKNWINTFPRVVSLDGNGRQLVQWPIKELESFRRKQKHLHDIELETGGLVEVNGLKVSEADVEVEFELVSLKTAEPFNADWVLDPPMLCREKGASVSGGVGPFGLLVLASHNLEEHTAIFFRVFKSGKTYKVLMCSDLRRSSLRADVDKPAYGAFVGIEINNDRKISLKALIDHSVVECFGAGGRSCITSRVYPTLLVSGGAHLYVFNNGTESIKISDLKAWSMDRPQIS